MRLGQAGVGEGEEQGAKEAQKDMRPAEGSYLLQWV